MATIEEKKYISLTAFCLLKAKRYDELLQIGVNSPEIIDYQAVAIFSRGDEKMALNQIRNSKVLKGSSLCLFLENKLFNKKILQRDFLNESYNGDLLVYESDKIHASDLVQEDNNLHLWPILSYQYSGNRECAQSFFQELSSKQPFNPNLAHTWALFSYSWAIELLELDRLKEFAQQFKIAIANFVYILVNEKFWQNWIAVRSDVYESPIDNEQITNIKAQITSYISEIIAQKIPQSSNTNAVELSKQLGISWEQEMEAARTMKNLGTLKKKFGNQEEAVGFGPLFMKHHSLETDMRNFFTNYSCLSSPRQSELINTLFSSIILGKDRFGNINSHLSRLKRLFSELGTCEVLIQRGQLQHSLIFLEINYFEDCEKFGVLDPEEILNLRNIILTNIQLQLGEHVVRERTHDFSKAAEYWSKALQSSRMWNGVDQTKTRIIQTALGRVEALQKKSMDAAIYLIEELYQILPEGELAGRLAELLRDRAVSKANKAIEYDEIDQLELILPDLRKAFVLNPYVRQSCLDLCMVLSKSAKWNYLQGDKLKTMEMLRENTKIAEEGLSIHRNDEQLLQFYQEAREYFAILQRCQVEEHSPVPVDFVEFIQLVAQASQEGHAKAYQ